MGQPVLAPTSLWDLQWNLLKWGQPLSLTTTCLTKVVGILSWIFYEIFEAKTKWRSWTEIWAIRHEAYEAFLPAKKSSDLDPISMQCIGAVKKKWTQIWAIRLDEDFPPQIWAIRLDEDFPPLIWASLRPKLPPACVNGSRWDFRPFAHPKISTRILTNLLSQTINKNLNYFHRKLSSRI